jgi:uncharacterized protein (TIRG00374 family)
MPLKTKRALQFAAAIALMVLFMWLFLRNANMGDVWKIIRTTDLWWLAGGLVVNFMALIFRTLRWRLVLDPDDPPPFYPTFFANTIGYMLSTILPIRASDVARPALLARRTSHRFSGALGTVLIERILDLISILSLFVFFAVLRWNEFSHDPHTARWFYVVRAGAIASAVILVVLLCFIAGVLLSSHVIRRAHDWLGRFLPARFRESWMNFFDTFVSSLAIARRPVFLAVVGCTAGVWLCLTGQFWFATNALHHPLPFDSSFFVTGVTTVGLAIPTPGGVGGFHKACQLLLTHFYGFDIDASVAVAVVFHIIGTLPILIVGLALFTREGLRWKDVTKAS